MNFRALDIWSNISQKIYLMTSVNKLGNPWDIHSSMHFSRISFEITYTHKPSVSEKAFKYPRMDNHIGFILSSLILLLSINWYSQRDEKIHFFIFHIDNTIRDNQPTICNFIEGTRSFYVLFKMRAFNTICMAIERIHRCNYDICHQNDKWRLAFCVDSWGWDLFL